MKAGSSPRGRGKPTWRLLIAQASGLIPARAGKTHVERTGEGAVQAHPRAGGENDLTSTGAAVKAGSSPRGRGKPALGEVVERGLGLIPARAGKTRRAQATPSWARAHPRAGGENMVSAYNTRTQEGSSPRGRGKPLDVARETVAGRLIPARAGKTRAARTRGFGARAHPRAGGEN